MFETELLTVFNTLKLNASISGDDEDTFDVLSELESAMDDLLSLAPEMLETELEFDVFDVYYLTNANIQSAITNCLSESPVYGLCATYGLNTTKFGTLPDWDVSRVSDLKKAFRGYNTFNADISKWNTEKVTTMYGMFWSASAFNQDIGSWNTEKVTTMYAMFQGAKAFNHDIGEWNTAKVTNMDAMFWSASVFNQDIGSWNTEKMTCMRSMFGYASAFNQDIGGWNTEKVTNMQYMFYSASAFNQDISSWTGTAATTVQASMFSGATSFQDKFTCTNADTGPANSCTCTKCISYTHYARACVGGYNIIKHAGKTVEQCKEICSAMSNCVAFEFGVAYGGGGGYQTGDCQPQSSANPAGCDGSYYNLDLYVKDPSV
ncbi:unnamed protein product [Bathycoccus prasinos]